MALSATLRRTGPVLWVRALSAGAAIALPLVLTWSHLPRWWKGLTVPELGAIAATAAVSLAGANGSRSLRILAIFAAAGATGVTMSVVFGFACHASLAGLLECLVLLPQRLAGAFMIPGPAPAWAPAVVAVAVALALVCARLGPSRLADGWLAAAVALAKLALAGVAVAASWIGSLRLLHPGLTSFLWLVLLPRANGSPGPARAFPRLVLVWLAVLQPLQMYPVAGSQMLFGTFLHTVCGAVALGDALAWIQLVCPVRARLAVRLGAALTVLAVAGGIVQGTLAGVRAKYAGLTPLGLPGTERVRVPADVGEMLRILVRTLRRNADTFLTYPGFNSLYFWTGKAPPTLDALSHEVKLYPEERQAAMIEALLLYDRPFVVRSEGIMEPYPPFVARIDRSFVLGKRVGPYQLLVPRH
jgi:hypothetical protein